MEETEILTAVYDEPSALLAYEEHQEYNRWLDQEGVVRIGEATFIRSEILYRLDLPAYSEGLDAYKARSLKSLKTIIEDEFPTPIAFNFFRFEHSCESELEKLYSLRDTWEAIIFTLYALIVGEYRCRSLQIEVSDLNLNQFWSDRTYDRVTIIDSLLELAEMRSYDLDCACIMPKGIGEELRKLNRLRNVFSHVATPSSSQCQEIITNHYAPVLAILDRLKGLSDVKLARYSMSDDPLLPRFEMFRGHSMHRDVGMLNIAAEKLIASLHFLANRPVVALVNGSLYSLSPFLHCTDPTRPVQSSPLYFYKKKKSSHVYLYEGIGDSVETSFAASQFTNVATALSSIFVASTAGSAVA